MIRILFFLFPVFLSAQQHQMDLFFDEADALFGKYNIDGNVDYQKIKVENGTASIMKLISEINVDNVSSDKKKAYLINVYNVAVIDKIADVYPIQSVQEIGDFFDDKGIRLGAEKVSLNELEKGMIFEYYNDARLHFALVCGAVSCAPLRKEAYRPENLDEVLEQQIKESVDNHRFVNALGNTLYLSKLFDWYKADFGGEDNILGYINSKRSEPINNGKIVKYLPYDWTLNGFNMEHLNLGANANRYIVSSTIPKGQWEVKWFNNLYSEKKGEDMTEERATFFTSSLSVLYGASKRWNVGLSARYRMVKLESGGSNPLHVFSGGGGNPFRNGLTGIGPQIRVAPFPGLNNFSIQSAYVFAIGEDLSGSSEEPFIDWDGASWFTQLFNDYAIGSKFSLFTELDFVLEDIGNINQFSTPVTVILSYFPVQNVTFYGLTNYAPRWVENYDYFYQVGMGFKYQFTPEYEIEILVTDFTHKFLKESNGSAATYNLGLRVNFR